MATEWIKRVVELRHWEGFGRMKVDQVDGSWVGCVPTDTDSMAETMAKATADGVLWIRKRDLIECSSQEERLL